MAGRFGRTRTRTSRKPSKGKGREHRGRRRFPERAGKDWRGPLVTYREIELLRKFMTSSNKIMGRKRSGASAKEMATLRTAIKHARFIALVPYTAG
jgi:small subunit ribosomal protein S18